MTDASGSIQFVNQVSLNFFPKLTLSDLIGKPIHHFVFSKELDRFYKNQQQMRNIPLRIGLKQLLVNFRVIHEDLFLITLKDVTKFQQLNSELSLAQEQIRLFNQILDYSSDGICFIDHKETIIFYNKKMGEIDSKEPDGVRNKNYAMTLRKDIFSTDPLQNSLKNEQKITQHESFFASNGKKYNVIKQSRPLFLGNKKIGALSVVKDYSKTSVALDNILRLQKNERTRPIDYETSEQTTFLYSTPEMKQLVNSAKQAFNSLSHMLIHGSRGVGKGSLVDYIHRESGCSERPFFTLNCRAIPDHLLENALFGSSDKDHPSETVGLFESANSGTIFLDEIDKMGIPLQQKILNVIHNKKIFKPASLSEVPIDTQIVASMSVTPATAYEEKLVVEELLYYLSSTSLKIPSLKERRAEIPLLVNFFKENTERMSGQEPKTLNPRTLDLFMSYNYPGNIRQLKYIVESVISLSHDDCEIRPEHLPQYVRSTAAGSTHLFENPFDVSDNTFSLTEQVEAFEKKMILQVLKKTNYHITNSAAALGLSRQSLNYKIKKYELPIIRGGD